MSEQEETLSGGNVSQVVRIGNTVRRGARASTPTLQRLLAHVRGKGVLWVPEPLGMDEAGREVLSYLPGTVPHDRPAWIWSEQVLIDIARALRAWHDATVDFAAPDARWGLPPRDPREVICHNDFAPNNCVFEAGRFVGAIDFDACAPGPRLWDLAYSAYRFVPLLPGPDDPGYAGAVEKSPFAAAERARRLETFLSAYGVVGEAGPYRSSDLIRAAVDRLLALAAWTEDFLRGGGRVALADHAVMYRAHARWLSSRVPR